MSSFKFNVCEKIFNVKRNLKQHLIEKILLVITCTTKMFNKKNSVLNEPRYCAQEDFNITVCTNKNVRKLELLFDINNYGVSEQLGVVIEKKYNSKTVASGKDLFVISQIRQKCTFKEYSEYSGNKIVLLSPFKKRSSFCICSFMQKIYVIGGCKKFEEENFYSTIASCMCYDI